MKMKTLDVAAWCQAYYSSKIEVPAYMSLEEAINYAKDKLNDIPLGPLEYVQESDCLDEENCGFAEDDVICNGMLKTYLVDGGVVETECKVHSETKKIVEINGRAEDFNYDDVDYEFVQFDDGAEYDVVYEKTDSGDCWYIPEQ